METILFALGIVAVAGLAYWISRRTTGTGPSARNRGLHGGSAGDEGVLGPSPDYGSSHHHHHHGDSGGGWSGGGDGGGDSGGGSGGGGGD